MLPAVFTGTGAASLAAGRLDGGDSLAVFRVLLESAARPGRPVKLPATLVSRLPAPLLAVLALVDLDHHFVVLGDDDHDDELGDTVEREIGRWAPLIAAATDARPTCELGDADVVIARRAPLSDEIAAMRTGTASTPESGARLFVSCRTVAATESFGEGPAAEATRFSVTGPGAPEPRFVDVVGIDDDVVGAVAAANRSFPAGIDVWFVDDDGTVIAAPRSSTVVIGEVR